MFLRLISRGMKMDEINEQIFSMWEKGISSTIIAKKVGLTRSAVMGRVRRAQFAGITSIRKVPKKKSNFVPEEEIEIPFHVGVVFVQDLNIDSCRFVLPEKCDNMFTYCGQKISRGSYCPDHAALCYVPRRGPTKGNAFKKQFVFFAKK